MNIFRYETPSDIVIKTNEPLIFLAGPTVRGNQYDKLGPSWRIDAIKILEELKFEGGVIIPEFSDPYESDKGRVELPIWEHRGLTRADCILFWICRTRELYGLNTNSEHGYWLAKNPHKLVYSRPDDAFRIQYNDIMHERIYSELGITSPIFNNLELALKQAMAKAYNIWQEKQQDKRQTGYHH